MCGFIGCIHEQAKEQNDSEKKLLKQMNDLIVHRGPDDEGFFLMNISVSDLGG